MSYLFLLSYALPWLSTVLLYVAVYLLYAHAGRQLAAREKRPTLAGPSINQRVDVVLETIDGRHINVGPQSGEPHIFVFTKPRCPACDKMRSLLFDVATTWRARRVVVVHMGALDEAREFVSEMPSNIQAAADPSGELARLWRIPVTPYLVATAAKGVVVDKGGATRDRVETLLSAGNDAQTDTGQQTSVALGRG
jgi:thiol-disulfide isomerase/thioredoxin